MREGGSEGGREGGREGVSEGGREGGGYNHTLSARMVDVTDVTFSIDSAYSSGSRLLAMRATKLCRTRGRHMMEPNHKVS